MALQKIKNVRTISIIIIGIISLVSLFFSFNAYRSFNAVKAANEQIVFAIQEIANVLGQSGIVEQADGENIRINKVMRISDFEQPQMGTAPF